MEKFCPNCGTPLKEGARFCGGCGAKRPDTASQPTQTQYTPHIHEQKKKSKAPFFIGGGVIAAALVAVLIITNVSGLLNHSDGGNDNTINGSSAIAREDGDDSYYYFDWETIEMFGGTEGFAEWLRYGLELDAADYYDTVSGGSFMSPVEKVDVERGWLDGYPTAKD